MHEIVCVGDVHEGLSFDFRIDPETGISERALDLHGNFAKAARWAIEHDASLFCILGDLFDRAHVAPVFREMVRRDVIEPRAVRASRCGSSRGTMTSRDGPCGPPRWTTTAGTAT